jgi:hypothetical protein
MSLEPESTSAESVPAARPNRLPIILGICAVLALLLVFVRNYSPRRELERVMVSGHASYRGEPIVVGQIRFSPIAPSTGPLTIEQIRDGQFNTSLNGGLPVGTHRVEIKMFRPEEYATMGRGPGSPGPEQLLPEKFNSASVLKIDVPAGSDPFEHNFVLND